ncbi:MAG: glutamyl-tRNA reductase, partial [Alphaproteobacteria bacterium]
VLGQVKSAAGHARAAGLVGPELGCWIDWALRTARRVRTETTIGERPVSLAAAVLSVARSIHGDLAGRAGLVIGSGDVADLVARALKDGGLGRFAVSHPNERRVATLAQRLGANVQPFDRLDAALAGADIVVTALGSGRAVLTRAGLEAARRARRRRPIFVVDLSLPPDVDGGADDLDDIYVFRLDDLERVTEEGRASREGAREAAFAIVADSVAEFRRSGAEHRAVPAIVALRRAFEAERDRLLAEHPGLDGATATRLLVQRLLHGPSTALRAMAAAGDDPAAVEALMRRLFDAAGNDRRYDTDEAG